MCGVRMPVILEGITVDLMRRGEKSEIRNPKAERRPKAEIRNSEACANS
jgi:hypothetical protein